MGKVFRSAGALPPETLYVERVVLLRESGEQPVWIALGLGFGGIHYVEHPNAFDSSQDKYIGTYKDFARLVSRMRDPRKEVTSVPWSDVVDWTVQTVHNEVVASLNDGRELRFCPETRYQADRDGEIHTFGVKALALS